MFFVKIPKIFQNNFFTEYFELIVSVNLNYFVTPQLKLESSLPSK